MSDQQLVDGVICGDVVATAEFYDRYHKRVFAGVWRVLGADSEAEDMVQSVFEKMFNDISTLKKRTSLDSWVNAVTYRSMYNELRRRRHRSILFFVPEHNETPSAELNPEEALVFTRTRSILARLAPEDRLMFTLRFIEEATHPEIAEASGLSESTVKRRVARALKRFLKRAGKDSVLAEFIKGDHHVS